MQNTLIIGANSFLSVELIKMLGEDKITGIYHNNMDKLDGTDISKVPVKDLFSLKDEYNTVYFISAFISKGEKKEDEEKLFQVNVKLLQDCLVHFSKARFILASSVSVYGDNTIDINERSANNNTGNYGLSKLWAEDLVKKHYSYAIIRISSMYGIGMNKNTFLPKIISNALSEREIWLYGNGSRLQNYVSVNDVATLMIKTSDSINNGTYLAVNTMSHSNKQVAEIVQKNLPGISIKFIGEDTSPSFTYDASFTYKYFGLPEKKLDTELINLIKWIQK